MKQIIRGGRILNIAGRRAEAADILIDGDTIRAIRPPGLEAADTVEIDASDRLLIPGLVNAHTHGHSSLSRSLGDRWTLELMQNALAAITGKRTPEDKYLAAQISAVEMIRKGCTAAYDLPFEFPGPTIEGIEAVARAYFDTGMRAVVAPMLWEYTLYEVVPGLYKALPPDLQREADKFALAPSSAGLNALKLILKHWKFDRAQVTPAVAPTIPTHCSQELLVRLRDLAHDYDVAMHTHLAETKVQAITAQKNYGCSMTAYLADLDILGPKFTAAHAVWLDTEDVLRLADFGASVAHNPGSNARLGSGLAPIRPMLDYGVNIGIGTDSCTCSDNQNVFEAMRLSSFLIRLQEVDPGRWPSSDQVLRMATEGGARSLGFGDAIGTLAVGRKADIVFLNLHNAHYVPLNDPINQIVYGEDGTGVDSVMIGGKMVLDHGCLTTVDEKKLKQDAESAVERLLGEATQAIRGSVARLEAAVGRHCLVLGQEQYHIDRHAANQKSIDNQAR